LTPWRGAIPLRRSPPIPEPVLDLTGEEKGDWGQPPLVPFPLLGPDPGLDTLVYEGPEPNPAFLIQRVGFGDMIQVS